MFSAVARIRGKVTASVYRFPAGREMELLVVKDCLENEYRQDLKATGYPIWLAVIICFFTSRSARKLRDFNGEYRTLQSVNHNIVTDEGDALVADLMAQTPVRTKVANATGYIPVGTNWTGTTPKTNGWVNTLTGTPKALEATYPKLKGAWGAADDNVVQYRVIYAAASFGSVTINEAALTSHSTDVAANSCLAYAQVTPSVAITASDTLQIDWELTFTGS